MVDRHSTDKDNVDDSPDSGTAHEYAQPEFEYYEAPSNYIFIGESCHINGKILNCGTLEIAGVLESELETEEVIVRPGARINGKLKAKYAEIHGNVVGEVNCTELLDVRGGGMVYGTISYGNISVQTGGQLIGNIRHQPKNALLQPVKRQRSAMICDDTNSAPGTKKHAPRGLMRGKA